VQSALCKVQSAFCKVQSVRDSAQSVRDDAHYLPCTAQSSSAVRVEVRPFASSGCGILLEAEDVAEGIGEPGDLSSAGSRPDGKWMGVVHAGVAVELNAGLDEALSRRCYVRDLPAEDGKLLRLEITGEGGAENCSVQIEDESERRLVGEQGQTKLIAVECEGFVFVGNGNKGDVCNRREP
jgi:hypothetical protein